MNEILIMTLIAVTALLVGGGVGYWFADRRARAQAAKTEDVQKRFDDYRQQVTAHFGRTAEHFQAIGEQYRELYEHMASGAETLFDAPSPVAGLAAEASQAITDTAGSEPEERLEAGEQQSAAVESDEPLPQPADTVLEQDDESTEREIEAAPAESEAAASDEGEETDTVTQAEPQADESPRTYH